MLSSVRDEIAGQLAAVMVTFPVFLIVHSLNTRQLRKRPDLYYSPVRRWLTYLALVLAAIVLVADAVWFVASFLQGLVDDSIRARFARLVGARRRSFHVLIS